MGSFTSKAVGGFLIGLGIAFSWTGLGIGLLAAGAVIWIASTVVSTAGLERRDPLAIAFHLVGAVIFGVSGFFGGVLHFGSGATTLAALSIKLVNTGTVLQSFSLLAPALDLDAYDKTKPKLGSPPTIEETLKAMKREGIVKIDLSNFRNAADFKKFADSMRGLKKPEPRTS